MGTLSPVAVGQQHVQAHNDERSAINALQDDHVGNADLATALAPYALTSALPAAVAAQVETALETYSPGSTAGYAKVTSNLTSTSAAYPGTALSGLSITVVGNGRPIELRLILPAVAHTVAGTTITCEVTYNGASLDVNNMLAANYLAAAGKAAPIIGSREITIPDGTSVTFVVNAYASAAGTITFTGATYMPMELKAIRR